MFSFAPFAYQEIDIVLSHDMTGSLGGHGLAFTMQYPHWETGPIEENWKNYVGEAYGKNFIVAIDVAPTNAIHSARSCTCQ